MQLFTSTLFSAFGVLCVGLVSASGYGGYHEPPIIKVSESILNVCLLSIFWIIIPLCQYFFSLMIFPFFVFLFRLFVFWLWLNIKVIHKTVHIPKAVPVPRIVNIPKIVPVPRTVAVPHPVNIAVKIPMYKTIKKVIPVAKTVVVSRPVPVPVPKKIPVSLCFFIFLFPAVSKTSFFRKSTGASSGN